MRPYNQSNDTIFTFVADRSSNWPTPCQRRSHLLGRVRRRGQSCRRPRQCTPQDRDRRRCLPRSLWYQSPGNHVQGSFTRNRNSGHPNRHTLDSSPSRPPCRSPSKQRRSIDLDRRMLPAGRPCTVRKSSDHEPSRGPVRFARTGRSCPRARRPTIASRIDRQTAHRLPHVVLTNDSQAGASKG